LSFFNLKHRPLGGSGWDGMEPPPLRMSTVVADLRWQYALYRADRLPRRQIAAFLCLRVLHLIQYHRGWTRGLKDV
jgi:hypothetical protein